MPFHNFFSGHTSNNAQLEPKLPKSPRWPKSPKSPKTPKYQKAGKLPHYSKITKNPDGLDQCVGCNYVEILISRNSEKGKDGLNFQHSVILHNSFDELDKCARKCQICRVFRQSLLLEEITFQGIKAIQQSRGEVLIRWQETPAIDGSCRNNLQVDIVGEPIRAGFVNCDNHGIAGHLALRPNGYDAAVIEQVKGWLSTCRESHFGTCDVLKWSSDNPRFLVEILSSTSVQLREKEEGEYVALSYCWGNMQNFTESERDEVEKGMTVLGNIQRRRKPFSTSGLPTTVRDALHLLYEMEIRYAWIDTLCIIQDGPDKSKEVAMMHQVYSNALFTLCSCTTTQATEKLLDMREAWTQRTEPCRLGGKWLTTSDMSMNELRLRSPLAKRAWTLQEERLSPRLLYISSSRIHWSCAKGNEMELKPAYPHNATSLQRPTYAISDRNTEIPPAQEFLRACYNGNKELYPYWADIVKSYALRNMGNSSDRLTGLSGLAAKYLNTKRLDEYLAGIWADNLASGLAWRVKEAAVADKNETNAVVSLPWPSWSWAVLPLQTAIETNTDNISSPFFQRSMRNRNTTTIYRESVEEAIRRGEQVKELSVAGRIRLLKKPSSLYRCWSSVSRTVDEKEKFSFSQSPEYDMHAVDTTSGRVLVYEDRKREIVGQIDFHRDVNRVRTDQVELWALELGTSNMLLIEHCRDESWRRVGVAWDVREDYFEQAKHRTLRLI